MEAVPAETAALSFEHYLGIGGGALVLIAILLYFVRGGKTQVPAIVSCALGCLAVGAAGGIIAMAGFGYHWEKQTKFSDGPIQSPLAGGGGPPGGGMGPGGMTKKPGGGGAGGPGGGASKKPGGGGGGGGRGPSSQRQLATLVGKLELLTGKPIALELTPEQRAKISEQLQGLKDMEELKEEEAKKRLDSVLEELKAHRETLEAVGFRWPGAGGAAPAPDAPNAFKEPGTTKSLDSLQERLKK